MSLMASSFWRKSNSLPIIALEGLILRVGKTYSVTCHLHQFLGYSTELFVANGTMFFQNKSEFSDFIMLCDYSDFRHAYFGYKWNYSLESSKHDEIWTFLQK